MNTRTVASETHWRATCDLVLAANALPPEAAGGIADLTAELATALASCAPSADDLRALTLCNFHLLLDVLGATYFLRRFTPESPTRERFETTAEHLLCRPWRRAIEVAAHYAIVFDTYRSALNYRVAATPFVALAEDAFGRAFWNVRPRTPSDHTDFRYALYAQRLRGEPLRAQFTAAYGVELIETIRGGDATKAAWLLVAWTGANPLECAILPGALRLLDANPPEPRLAALTNANLRARIGEKPR